MISILKKIYINRGLYNFVCGISYDILNCSQDEPIHFTMLKAIREGEMKQKKGV